MYDTAVKMVKGTHADELGYEAAERRAAAGGAGTERGANVASTAAAAFDKLDEIYDTAHPFFENAREQRVTKDMIRSHCAKIGISVDEYVRNATLGTVIVTRNGFERRSS
jgi:hypothetical protein